MNRRRSRKPAAEPATPTVFIVDDDEAVRDSLGLLLESLGQSYRAYPAATDFLEDYDPDRPGCLLLDIRMPGMSGIELQERLNEMGAILPIVFITGHGDVPLAVKAIRAGAIEFLQKPYYEHELLDHVRRALAEDAERRSVLEERDLVLQRFARLTPRELEVLDLIVEGCANKVVANRLGVSQRTVEVHRAHVMQKTDASSFAHLMKMAMVLREAESE